MAASFGEVERLLLCTDLQEGNQDMSETESQETVTPVAPAGPYDGLGGSCCDAATLATCCASQAKAGDCCAPSGDAAAGVRSRCGCQ